MGYYIPAKRSNGNMNFGVVKHYDSVSGKHCIEFLDKQFEWTMIDEQPFQKYREGRERKSKPILENEVCPNNPSAVIAQRGTEFNAKHETFSDSNEREVPPEKLSMNEHDLMARLIDLISEGKHLGKVPRNQVSKN